MTTLHLTHIQHSQLAPSTWCITAHVSDALWSIDIIDLSETSVWLSSSMQAATIPLSNVNWYYRPEQRPLSTRKRALKQRRQQRQGVRKLLQRLLHVLNIQDGLDETSFPYRLNQHQYYVCFSHTGADNLRDSKIAVVISAKGPAGIDIEHNNIAWRVVQRFYSAQEVSTLQALPIDQRDCVTKLLWQIKESFIKVHQYTLAQGLGMNHASLIPQLIESSEKDMVFFDITAYQNTQQPNGYRIALLPSQQTVIVF